MREPASTTWRCSPPLLRNSFAKHPTDLVSRRRFLLFHSNSSDESTHNDLWAINTDGPPAGAPAVQTVSTESYGAISPDGTWLAYRSDESGRNEVLCTGLPARAGGDAPAVANFEGRGALARWQGDGKDLY